MTLNDGLSLAFTYAETLKDRLVTPTHYADMLAWYKAHGGTRENYSAFQDVVHMFSRTTRELRLSDAYMHMPE